MGDDLWLMIIGIMILAAMIAFKWLVITISGFMINMRAASSAGAIIFTSAKATFTILRGSISSAISGGAHGL